jgi:hypothetical protein
MRRVRSRTGLVLRTWGVLLVLLGLTVVSVTAVVAQETQSSPIQHGAQPNPGEVRPSSPDGNVSSPSTGTLKPDLRPDTVWGLPAGYVVGALAIAIAAVVVAVLMVSARRTPIQRQRQIR